MGDLSDEAAGQAAENAGDRPITGTEGPRIYAMEPATAKWGRPPDLCTMVEPAPTCTRCCDVATWTGPPRRRGGWWFYGVRCSCGADVIRSPVRLMMAGTYRWWVVLWTDMVNVRWPTGWGPEPPTWPAARRRMRERG